MPLNNEVSVLNIHNIDNDIKDADTRSMIAGEEKESYATNDYVKDQYFIWNDRKLYKVTAPITHGDTFVVGGNIKYVGTLASEIYNLYISSAEGIKDLIGNVEEANASKAYYFGDYIILASDGLLYQVTTNVSMGTAWAVGTNIKFVDNITTVITAIEQKLHKTQQMIATVEPTNVASRSYEIGEQFIFQNILVEAAAHIEQQSTITLNANCKPAGAVANQLHSIKGEYKKRSFLLMGDSLFGGYTPGASTHFGWGYWVQKYLQDKGYDAYLMTDLPGIGNTGFATVKTYVKQLNKTLEDNPDIANVNITDIVIYTGSNDRSAVDATEQGVANFAAAVKQHWPNASIKIGYFSPHHDLAGENIIKIFKDSGKYGCSYILNSAALLCDASTVVDGTHLTQEAYKFYSSYLAMGAISGSMSYEFIFENIPVSSTNGTMTGIGMNFRVKDGIIYQYLSNIGSDTASFVFTTSGSDRGELGGITYAYPLTLRVKQSTIANTAFYDPNNNGFRGVVRWMQYSINQGNIRLYLYGPSGNGRIDVYGQQGVAISHTP